MSQDKEPTPGKKAAQTKGPAGRSKAASKAGATRAANKTYRVILDAISRSEERLAAMIAKSEAGIHAELASIRQELEEIDRSVKFIAKTLLSSLERCHAIPCAW